MSNFVCRLCGGTSFDANGVSEYCVNCGVRFNHASLFTLPPVMFKRLSDDAVVPTRAKLGDVGYDLCASAPKLIGAGKVALVKTDIAVELPANTEIQIRSRSGMGKKGIMVANQPGTIDTGYRGMCGVLLFNSTDEAYDVEKGDRIAQMLVTPKLPYVFVETQELSSTERGEGGYGHTGK